MTDCHHNTLSVEVDTRWDSNGQESWCYRVFNATCLSCEKHFEGDDMEDLVGDNYLLVRKGANA